MLKSESANSTTLSPQTTSSKLPLFKTLLKFKSNELRMYSLMLLIILVIGVICHFLVLAILAYQQIKRRLNSSKGELYYTYELEEPGGGMLAKNKKNTSNLSTIECYYKTEETTQLPLKPVPFGGSSQLTQSNVNNIGKQQTTSATIFKPNKDCISKDQIYNNYVTYAFVFHQTLVDLMRIFYSLLYANSLFVESNESSSNMSPLSPKNIQDNHIENYNASIDLNAFYDKYCIQMATFYSVLTMVTIVNILAILISETCRFYDLKLNSSDTSNFCCVLFGILLIWTSSLIIISSLMLVGVADSASPTWRCELGEESTTRSLVINIVWFFLVSFVLVISFSYSFSLYKELSSLDYKHHRLSLYAVNASFLSLDNNSNFLRRHIFIVEETSRRLIILISLIVVFCITFMPNFIMTLVKNTIDEKVQWLKQLHLICSIISLSNATLNSIILLILCIKSNNAYLRDDESDSDSSDSSKNKLVRLLRMVKELKFKKQANEEDNRAELDRSEQENNENENGEGGGGGGGDGGGDDDDDDAMIPLKQRSNRDEESSSVKLVCNEGEYIKLNSLPVPPTTSHQHNKQTTNASSSSNQQQTYSNVKEFYSKVGNRLGTNVN
jgi:hypothetical protein